MRVYPEKGDYDEFSAFEHPVVSIHAFESQATSYLLCGDQQTIGLWEPVRQNYSVIGNC